MRSRIKSRALMIAAIAISICTLGLSELRAEIVGLYRFENVDVGLDSSGSGNDLVTNGDATQSGTAQIGSGSLSLDGVGDMLTGTPFGLPIGNSNYSIAAWIKPNEAADDGIVGWGNYGSSLQVNAFRTFGNGFRHYWWGADYDRSAGNITAAGGTPLLDGNWHHVVATFDGTNRSIYYDGLLLGSDVPGANNASGANFAVGRTCTFCGGGEFFNGSMDDVAIFNEPLNASQVTTIMGGNFAGFSPALPPPPPPPPPAPTLIGLYRFENANIGLDSSDAVNNLATNGDAAQGGSAAVGSGSLVLDGNGDMLTGTPTGLPTGDSSYTLAAWFKTTNSSQEGIVGWGNYGGTGQVNGLRTDGNGFAHYWWGGGFDLVTGNISPKDILDGEWHHIAATYDGTNRILYLDGDVLDQDAPPDHSLTADNFAVGRTCTFCSGGEFFGGTLDDVAIFTGALSSSEIQTIASGDFSNYVVPEPSSFVLIALGLISLIGANRIRRRKN